MFKIYFRVYSYSATSFVFTKLQLNWAEVVLFRTVCWIFVVGRKYHAETHGETIICAAGDSVEVLAALKTGIIIDKGLKMS